MRLTHIFWALLVVVGMILLPVVLFLNKGKLNGGPELFGTFLLFWWLLDLLSPAALAIAWYKKLELRYSFFYTLLAVLNLYFGLMGFYHLPIAGSFREYMFFYLLFFLNLTWAAIIGYLQLHRPK